MDKTKGVVMTFIAPDGHVSACVHEFDQDKAGGFDLEETQKLKCRRKIARVVIDNHCSPILCEAIDDYQAERIINNMTSKQGYTTHFHLIGYDD